MSGTVTNVVQRTGLRERKRFMTMRRVQNAALDLFDEHGYTRVTIEQIADSADVSTSSVYRHFGTKEGVLLWNPHHEQALQQLDPEDDREPLLAAFRRLTAAVFADGDEAANWQRRRVRYLLGESAVSAALVDRMGVVGQQVAELLASRTGRDAGELEIQVTVGAVVGGLLGALRAWHAGGYAEPLLEVIDGALATLHEGLPLVADH